MLIVSSTLVDLLRKVFDALLREAETYTAHKGDFKELFGACLQLTDPRGRLSMTESKGKIYSALGVGPVFFKCECCGTERTRLST